MVQNHMRVGLALSGGGVRAAVFHFGVLRRLADKNMLEAVSGISTVSGGSLAAAIIMSKAGLRWPDSITFLKKLYPDLRRLLTSTDLFSLAAVGWTGIWKYNARLLSHRAAVLADLLNRKWGVEGKLAELPEQPLWWINATCFETGKNWHFSKREMGDWQFGRHYSPPFSLAEAAAASAAVPYVIGALKLGLPTDGWYRTDPATRAPEERVRPAWPQVRLWDGGAYENLGVEALFKPSQPLRDCDFLICSDASGPLRPAEDASPLNLLKGQLVAPRLFDVAGDQIRSLRSRMLVGAIEAGTVRGALLRMGNSVRDIDIKAGRRRASSDYDLFQTEQEVATASSVPTALSAISETVFDLLARHAYEVADATLTTYSPSEFSQTRQWRSCE
jgi:NTE family protein